MASPKQIKFLEELFIDTGIGSSRVARNAYMNSELKLRPGRVLRYIDDMDVSQASKIIDKLLILQKSQTSRRLDAKAEEDKEL